ncbi:unnamed protein product [Cylicocyclus nassatus]|uniref:Uncharacterized protein n=1 Tax=Cylicocyclus nassatus TaxID=53992 RepID=A0AA36GGW3_CYLNA|nr:unnamed protein product [Cylicocyclus nassatus]
MTTVLTVILLIVSLVPTSGDNHLEDYLANDHKDLMTVTLSPKALMLLKKKTHLIEDAVRSIRFPDISEKDGSWRVYADEIHFKKFSVVNDISFEDGNGLRLYLGGIVYNIGARIKVKHTLGQATERFEFYSYNANMRVTLGWNDFNIVPSTNVNLNLKIEWPKVWYYAMLPSSLKNKIRNMINDLGEKIIRDQVNKVITNNLNPRLQGFKQRLKDMAFFKIIEFDKIAVDWCVQKQYLRAALISKSSKPVSEVVPIDKMLCIDANLGDLFAALPYSIKWHALMQTCAEFYWHPCPLKRMIMAVRTQSANLEYDCVAPEFMCEGLHCRFCSDLESTTGTNTTSDIFHNKNQTETEVQPFSEMFSVGGNLLKILSAALSDEKAIIATQEQGDEKYLNCFAPRALCNGADCQFFFNVDVVSTPKYFGDFFKCFSYE